MRFVAIVAAALCLCHGQDKKKKPPDIQVLEVKVRREGNMVTIDGRLRATGEKPISRLVLSFDFLSEHATLVTKKAGIDEDALKTGDEAPFHVETDCPAKAVELKINAFKNGNVELIVGNSGPHPIMD
jgi:hypothetical protein